MYFILLIVIVTCVISFIYTYKKTTIDKTVLKLQYGKKLEDTDILLSQALNEIKLTNKIRGVTIIETGQKL